MAMQTIDQNVYADVASFWNFRSTCAVAGDNFVVVASDTRMTAGEINVINREVDKIHPLWVANIRTIDLKIIPHKMGLFMTKVFWKQASCGFSLLLVSLPPSKHQIVQLGQHRAHHGRIPRRRAADEETAWGENYDMCFFFFLLPFRGSIRNGRGFVIFDDRNIVHCIFS